MAAVPAPPRVLTIAGSDSSGGAGIQADLKAFAAAGVYGMSAITAVTAQNTREILAVAPVAPELVALQIGAVLSDIGVDAVKIGMLATVENVHAVATALEDGLPAGVPVVLDPVQIASTGALLLQAGGLRALRERLVPLATVLTPNVEEARLLLVDAGGDAGAALDSPALATALLALGPTAVVLTGGHRKDGVGDLYADAQGTVELGGEWFPGGATHGSGCTHSSALAAALACGMAPLEAARCAAGVAGAAVRNGLRDIGGGEGPVDVLGLCERLR